MISSKATLILMARFYDYLKREGLPPHQALRAAQRWLRDTTNREKANYFHEQIMQSRITMEAARKVTAIVNEMIEYERTKYVGFNTLGSEEDPVVGAGQAKSLAHIQFWAAFQYCGA